MTKLTRESSPIAHILCHTIRKVLGTKTFDPKGPSSPTKDWSPNEIRMNRKTDQTNMVFSTSQRVTTGQKITRHGYPSVLNVQSPMDTSRTDEVRRLLKTDHTNKVSSKHERVETLDGEKTRHGYHLILNAQAHLRKTSVLTVLAPPHLAILRVGIISPR